MGVSAKHEYQTLGRWTWQAVQDVEGHAGTHGVIFPGDTCDDGPFDVDRGTVEGEFSGHGK